jgi:hypothetical protein
MFHNKYCMNKVNLVTDISLPVLHRFISLAMDHAKNKNERLRIYGAMGKDSGGGGGALPPRGR